MVIRIVFPFSATVISSIGGLTKKFLSTFFNATYSSNVSKIVFELNDVVSGAGKVFFSTSEGAETSFSPPVSAAC